MIPFRCLLLYLLSYHCYRHILLSKHFNSLIIAINSLLLSMTPIVPLANFNVTTAVSISPAFPFRINSWPSCINFGNFTTCQKSGHIKVMNSHLEDPAETLIYSMGGGSDHEKLFLVYVVLLFYLYV